MNKTWTIIKREYTSRVFKKSFIITTLVIPIIIFAFTILMGYIASRSKENQTIIVDDNSNYFHHQIESKSKSYKFIYSKPHANESNQDFLKRLDANILMRIFPFKNGKADSVHLFKEGGISALANEYIEEQLNDLYQQEQMNAAGLSNTTLDSIYDASINVRSFDLENNQETSSEIAMMIGYVMGVLIYIIILIYGTGVMRGVMEEKTNRIAEVIVSSVKPFQLMIGKIIGIGLVGLTQLGLWFVIMFVLQMIALPFLGAASISTLQDPNVTAMSNSLTQDGGKISHFLSLLASQNWFLIIGMFIFYFLGGYFLYASMFAAVGSLVNEDPQEAQQLSFPITMPIILAFVIMSSSMQNPHSGISVFGSLFPLTSPIVMMSRLPYQVPTWQLILSMALLVIGFLAMAWLSGKIYRTGILMYGKKPNWKDLIKAMRQS
jgi:ABC-2 type transport system permease protein